MTQVVQLGEPERQPVLVEGVEDGQLLLGEEEADVDPSLGDVVAGPFEELDVLEDLALKGVQRWVRVLAPLQLEVGPQDRLVGIDAVLRDREVVELVVVDLDLLSIEVEQDGAVGEPFIVLKVPDQPGASEPAADEHTQGVALGGRDGGAAGQPLRPVAFDPEVEHARVPSGRCTVPDLPDRSPVAAGRTEMKQAPDSHDHVSVEFP